MIYSAAGLCDTSTDSDSPISPTITSASTPDQPASRIPPSPSDDDYVAYVPCFGDQLT